MPKVSICIPVYNVESLIDRCLDSVQNQTLSDIEIIVVDDCTPDGSMSIVTRRANNDNRIRIIKHSQNLGLMEARKSAYLKAVSPFIMFCDSDDALPCDSAEILYNEAIQTGADIVSGNICYVDVKGNKSIRNYKLSFGSDKISVYKSLLENEFCHNLWNKIYKRELLQNNEYITYKNFINGEDGCLFYQLVNNCNFIHQISNVVYLYYQNLGSSTNVRLNDRALWSISVLNSMRLNTAGQYLELKDIVSQKISGIIWGLKARGYNIDKHVSDQGLDHFAKVSTFIKDHGIFEFISIYLKMIFNKF